MGETLIKRPVRAKRRRPGRGAIPARGNSLPEVYLSRTKTGTTSIFDKDHFGSPASARFKWLVSTIIAGTVGVAALGVALYGAMNVEDGSGMVESLKNASLSAMQPFTPKTVGEEQAISVFGKTDRLPATSQGLSTRYIIHDSVVRKKNDREFIAIKPYARIVARLATDLKESDEADGPEIPLFNPFKLYANLDPVDKGTSENTEEGADSEHAEIKVVDLTDGILPAEDGQEMNDNEIQRLVSNEYQSEDFEIRATIYNETLGDPEADTAGEPEKVAMKTPAPAKLAKNTTVIEKSIIIPDEDSIEGLENNIVAVGPKDDLQSILDSVKVSDWQAPAVAEAMEPIFSAADLKPGQELHLMLVPSLTQLDEKDLVRVSIYESGVHIVSVSRNAAGEFVASNHGAHSALLEQLASRKGSNRASLYTSFYQSALKQKLTNNMIMKILRIHAYDADFKQRVSPGDSVELFFDTDETSSTGQDGLGALLYTAMTIGGETRRFYRYRTRDGEVDYYDENGDNAKKFLTRKPVRSGNVRLTSGFGLRHHPLLKRRKMHKGVDWAAKPGTPILAAGNGRIEEAKRHSGYGNYIRIKHANGYKTAYAHMLRFAKGMHKGARVRQGQIIGYVGSTGLSSGPHLHYEILVNNRHVNPMRIHVPRGRQLRGKLLTEFQKERKRIDELMRLAPVKTRVAKNTQ